MRVLFLFMTIFMFGCQSTETLTEEKDDFAIAELALISGHPERALDVYRKKLSLAPNDPQLLLLAGAASNQTGRYDEALHYLEKGNQQHPSSAFQREIGRAQLAKGDIALAVKSLFNATQLDPKDDVAFNSLGVSYSLNKQYSLAREVFETAISLKVISVEYRNNLALAWMLDGNAQKGIQILFPIYQRGEASEKVRQNLALAYALAGDSEAAMLIAKEDLSTAELESNQAFYQRLNAPVSSERL